MKSVFAVRHVHFEDLGVLEPFLEQQGYQVHYVDAGIEGEALLFALKRAGAPLQAVCGGKGACGTCRVHVPLKWRPRTGGPSRREARLLQYLGAAEGDRLSCQIQLTADLNGLELQLCADSKGDAQ